MTQTCVASSAILSEDTLALETPLSREHQNGTQRERAAIRVLRALRDAAAILVLSTLLFGVALLVIDAWGDDRKNVGRSTQLPSERFVPEHYYLCDAQTVANVARDFDRFQAGDPERGTGPWRVHPWTGLIPRPFQSATLEIDDQGRRITLGASPDEAGTTSAEEFRVWVFGGSTVFGWGVPDAHTLPSHLQAELKTLMPGRRVVVVNFGAPWFNSSHELALFIGALRDGEIKPQVALFLHGLNDVGHRVYRRTESPLITPLASAWAQRERDQRGGAPWLRPTESFPLHRLYRHDEGSVPHHIEPQGQELDALVRQALRTYRSNRNSLRALASDSGIRALFALQPVPRWLAPDRKTIANAGYERFVSGALHNQGADTLDLTQALAALPADKAMAVEVRGTHYTDLANRLLARRLLGPVTTP